VLTGSKLEGRLEELDRTPLVRFLTCGSVDDGKSTLIGRLLYEAGALYADHLTSLERDSRSAGSLDGELDFALLLDGLSAEREQGITIDVAYRHFSTPKRRFIIADTPGHEQYTRNMATGASTADCAVLLVDARKGLLTQTRRHSYVVSALGIEQVALAVNKMDLVGYSAERFTEIEAEFRSVASDMGLRHVVCIPVSALRGDNVVSPSPRTPWYHGQTLLEYLEAVEINQESMQDAPFRFPVQWVNRPNLDFRGFAGTIAGGSIHPGDEVVVMPSRRKSRIARIVTLDGDLDAAVAGQAVTLTLADDLDVSRGDSIALVDQSPGVASQFEATVVWMTDEPMLRGRTYLVRIGTKVANATVAPLKYKINVNTLERVAATRLELNEIGVCDLELDQPIAFDPYADNRDTGGFILIDRLTLDTVGAGMIHFALHRSQNVRWQSLDVSKAGRARIKGQNPCVIWLTGLPAAGKSTIANLVEQRLHERGRHTYLLDGDNVRHGLNKDLGFTAADRVENIRRAAEVAKLMVDAGLIVLVSFISPFRSERLMARSLLDAEEFMEVFVDTPLVVAEQRDPKGLYRKARAGQIKNFTGIDSPYEAPEHPELHLETARLSPADCAERVIQMLEDRGILRSP
jgi:bifunctional enzyme CysN/CysC